MSDYSVHKFHAIFPSPLHLTTYVVKEGIMKSCMIVVIDIRAIMRM